MKFLFLFLFVFSCWVFAQSEFMRELNPFIFKKNGINYKNVFTGGFNNIEPQFIDIDGDGDKDLFFINSDGTFGWFKNVGTVNNPEFLFMLDSIPGIRMREWFYFVDIDNDDDLDLYTAGETNYISFYRNTGSSNNPIFFLEIDSLKTDDNNIIFTEVGSNTIFIDIDNDGDYDIITGNTIGSLTYYENIGTPENPVFRYITNFWLGIIIISEGKNLHGASSLDFVDIDNDGDYDMFWGDFFSRSLYYLENIGTPSQPDFIRRYNVYPPNEDSLITSGFNMPRFVDIDGDGDFDLFVSVLYDPTVLQSLIYYENIGTAAFPNFRKITEDYLFTLDVGIQSVPFICDLNNNGKLDFFIGAGSNPNGSIYNFEQIENLNQIEFNLIDSIAFNIINELSIAPQFIDIDGDGDLDLFTGNFDGTISFYKNIGTLTNPEFQFIEKLKDNNQNIIDVGLYARTQFIDIDNDGDFDLIIGAFNGRIYFYENFGTNSQFNFTEVPSYFGNLDVGDNSAPFLISYSSPDKLDMFVGNRKGNIFYYKNNGTNASPVWELLSENFFSINFGGDAVPYFFDIDNDGDYDLFVGNVKGGLYFFRNTSINSINEYSNVFMPNDIKISAYPNPFNSSVKILVEGKFEEFYDISIYSVLGEKVFSFPKNFSSNKNLTLEWNCKNLNNENVSSGIYFITVSTINKIKSQKLILNK